MICIGVLLLVLWTFPNRPQAEPDLPAKEAYAREHSVYNMHTTLLALPCSIIESRRALREQNYETRISYVYSLAYLLRIVVFNLYCKPTKRSSYTKGRLSYSSSLGSLEEITPRRSILTLGVS